MRKGQLPPPSQEGGSQTSKKRVGEGEGRGEEKG